MIFWNPEAELNLRDFGILVPSSAHRAYTVREALKHDAKVGHFAEKWFCSLQVAPATEDELLLAHTSSFLDRALRNDPDGCVVDCYELIDSQGSLHRYNPAIARRPLSDIVANERKVVAGTTQAARETLKSGFGYYLGGGWHHSIAQGGRGFCFFNDIVIALRVLQRERRVVRAWVIDTDAHKGDGTAALTVDDPSILTLSIHMATGWPLDDSPLDSEGHLKPWWYPSTIDIPIPEGGDHLYLGQLREGLTLLNLHSPQRPDLVIVVNGSDPYRRDALPGSKFLQLDLPDLLERDLVVYRFLENLGVPHLWLMSGGYGDEVWEVHTQFLREVMILREN